MYIALTLLPTPTSSEERVGFAKFTYIGKKSWVGKIAVTHYLFIHTRKITVKILQKRH